MLFFCIAVSCVLATQEEISDHADFPLYFQDFEPQPNSFDIIWIQWVIGHLHDLDFIRFFKRCAAGLRPGGFIVLKDNVLKNSEYTFMIDRSDSSITRHDLYIKLLFNLSGLRVAQEATQVGFPEELYPVVMFALEPIDRVSV